MKPSAVLETVLYCEDLAAAERFYGVVLGLEAFAREAGRHVFFRLHDAVFLVFDPRRTSREPSAVAGAPIPLHGATGAGHVAFRIPERDFERWKARLVAMNVEIESEVKWPGGGRSFYFRDPAQNSVELATAQLWGFAESE